MKTPCNLNISESQSCQKRECKNFIKCIELRKEDLLLNFNGKCNIHSQNTTSQNSNTTKDGSKQ